MCGIAGQFNLQPLTSLELTSRVLLGALRHRGPDDEGSWISPDQRVLLVQTRLAILDLSPAGHQPMVWEGGGENSSVVSHPSSPFESGKPAVPSHAEPGARNEEPITNLPVIVFNGEIYNFLELRVELEAEGVVFRTRTDTEVILALYARDGVRCLERLRGMYAFALWDPARQTAFLARDPHGIKPRQGPALGRSGPGAWRFPDRRNRG